MEEEKSRQKKTNFHLAGIIPVASLPFDFKMPWHDSLMPISQNYLAVEKSVYECAMAGCETIWIVCHKETTPLIRHRVGEWILDPTRNYSVLRNYYSRCDEHVKRVPIFYLPIHPKDRDVRDGLTWSIITGYKKAYHISRMFSRWATPSKYYVSFPYGVYSPSSVRGIRRIISSKQSIFLRTPSGKTAKDGEYVGFSFDTSEYSGYRRSFLEAENRRWKNGKWENGKFTGEEIEASERYNGATISLDKFLETADVNEENSHDLSWYYDISSWEGYCTYLSSTERKRIRRPKFGFKYNEFNPLALDNTALDMEDEE
jgi:hypothetical protein